MSPKLKQVAACRAEDGPRRWSKTQPQHLCVQSTMSESPTPALPRFNVLRIVFLSAILLASQPTTASSFLNTGPMPVARDSHTATLLLNGKTLVAGGSDGTNALGSAELYDPITGSWTSTGSLHTRRQANTATLLLNG